MTFIEITADINNKTEVEKHLSVANYKKSLLSYAKQSFYSSNSAYYFFISNIDDDVVHACAMILSDSFDKFCHINICWQDLQLDVSNVSYIEICSDKFASMLMQAYENDLVESFNSILRKAGLFRVFNEEEGICAGSNEYAEQLVDNLISEEQQREIATNLFWDELLTEFDRIQEKPASTDVTGLPVHYIFNSNDNESRDSAISLLLSSLYQNNRLKIRRACSIKITQLDSRDFFILNKVYDCYTGGTIVICYNNMSNSESDEAIYDSSYIENLCKLILKYKNKVLTVLCFPLSSTKEKDEFFSYLSNISFVSFTEGNVGKDRAMIYLKKKAESDHCLYYDSLLQALTSDTQYNTFKLNSIYRNWFDNYIKTKVYPQYQSIMTVSSEIAKQAPRGSAYDELQHLIGLQSVKSIIDSIINYYKAQQLLQSRNIFTDSPALHMVFTGNPGTAKTTVARLIGRILKDNKILSSGHLIEVGRSELVAKYVGWTAKAVKDKFRQARGGVLFIDEAYSLLDGRGGSYGDEAINTIVQEMENNRKDLVVILAGYTHEMKDFLSRNSGLQSRIAYHISFPDYSADELYQIAENICKQKQMKLANDVKARLTALFNRIIHTSDFGNGRYVRNIIEKAIIQHANKLIQYNIDEIDDEIVCTLTADDFIIEQEEEGKNTKIKIGFCA